MTIKVEQSWKLFKTSVLISCQNMLTIFELLCLVYIGVKLQKEKKNERSWSFLKVLFYTYFVSLD